MEFKVTKSSFTSKDGERTLSYTVWQPGDLASGMIQIFHNMHDCMERYGQLAEYLCKRGFIVFGCDLAGFGESCTEKSHGGYIGKPVDDHYSLYEIMRGKYRYLPYMIFSMGIGSVIARSYIFEHKDIADGVIFGGSISEISGAKRLLVSITALFKGKYGRSHSLDSKCFNKYSSEFSRNAGMFSFLSGDENECRLVAENEKCNSVLTVSAIKYIAKSFGDFEKNRWFLEYPANVFTLLMRGENDCLGGMGKAQADIVENFGEQSSMSDLDAVTIENSKHDFLHDINREIAMEKAYEFYLKVVEGVNLARTIDRENFNFA